MWATRLITKTTAFFKKSIYKMKILQYKHRQHLEIENKWRFWDFLTKEPSMWKIENAWYHTEQIDHIKEKVSVYGSVQNSLNWHITDLQPILHPQVKDTSTELCLPSAQDLFLCFLSIGDTWSRLPLLCARPHSLYPPIEPTGSHSSPKSSKNTRGIDSVVH